MSRMLKDTIWGEEAGSGQYSFYIQPRTVHQFLTEGAMRKIPDYQRPYSWTKRHTETLLSDIEKNADQDKTWFLGTIYTTKPTQRSLISSVLDGQQRLTTIQLILKEFTLFHIFHDNIDFSSANGILVDSYRDLVSEAKNCLFTRGDSEIEQRFQTEENTNEHLIKYILGTRNTESKQELESALEEINASLSQTSAATKTAKSLQDNILFIRDFLNKLYHRGGDINENLSRLNSFIETLLHKLWLIEVPLKEESFSLEIFEGINNRGKQLDLLDKLQFRSVTKLIEHSSIIKRKWKDAYVQVEDLIADSNITRAFSNHTDFYKTLFLGITGKEEPDNDDLVDKFEALYLQSEETILEFFKILQEVVSIFKAIQNPNSEDKFIKTFSSMATRQKVISLFQIARRTIVESKSTRPLIVSLVCHYDVNAANQNLIVQALWNICRLVLLKDALNNERPQNIRNDFNRIIKYASEKDSQVYIKLFTLLSDEEKAEGLCSLGDLKLREGRLRYATSNLFAPGCSLLKTKDNETGKLIQYFITHYSDSSTLGTFSPMEYKKEELEHVFPRAYNNHWSDKVYSTDEVVDAVEKAFANNSYFLDKDSIITQIRNAEDIELKSYTTSPFVVENALIEWHGNKVDLSMSQNRRNNNLSFEQKQEKFYDNTNNLVAPRPQSKFGIPRDNWTHNEIVARSILIMNFLVNDLFNIGWDDTIA